MNNKTAQRKGLIPLPPAGGGAAKQPGGTTPTGGGTQTGGGAAKPPSSQDDFVARMQKEYPKAVAGVSQMQQAMGNLSLSLYTKYANQQEKDPQQAQKISSVQKFRVTQAGGAVEKREDGVWGPNTRKAIDEINAYIKKYIPQITEALKNVPAGMDTEQLYKNQPMVDDFVLTNIRVINLIYEAEGVENVGGIGVDAAARELDKLPPDVNTARSDLLNDSEGVPITAQVLASLDTLYKTLSSGMKNIAGLRGEEIKLPPEAQVLLRNFSPAASTPSMKDITPETYAGFLESQGVIIHADVLWNTMKNAVSVGFMSFLSSGSGSKIEFKVYYQALNYFAKVIGITPEALIDAHISRYEKNLNIGHYVMRSETKTKIIDTFVVAVNDVFVRLGDQIKGQAMKDASLKNIFVPAVPEGRGRITDENFGEAINRTIDIANQTIANFVNNKISNELSNPDRVITSEGIAGGVEQMKQNPASMPAGYNQYLSQHKASEDAETRAGTYWTIGQLTQIIDMLERRARAQLAAATKQTRRAAEINELIKVAQPAIPSIVNPWAGQPNQSTQPIQFDPQKGPWDLQTQPAQPAPSGASPTGSWSNFVSGVKTLLGMGENSSPMAPHAMNRNLKTAYVQLVENLKLQLQGITNYVSEQLRDKPWFSEEAVNAVIIPPGSYNALARTIASDPRTNDDIRRSFGGGAGGSGGSSGGYGSGFGSRNSGAFGTERQGKQIPSDGPFLSNRIDVPLMLRWANLSDEGPFGFEEFVMKMPSLAYGQIESPGVGSIASDLTGTFGNDWGKYLEAIRFLAGKANEEFAKQYGAGNVPQTKAQQQGVFRGRLYQALEQIKRIVGNSVNFPESREDRHAPIYRR